MYSKIGLIGAMAEEIEHVAARMEQVEAAVHAGIQFQSGQFCGKPVVLCRSGVGKVNAALCTQLLIDRYGVDAVLFTGVAGALDPVLNIGDIVISSDCQQHDMDVTALGFARGVIPYSELSVFAADPYLIRLAQEASASFSGHQTVLGRVLSGDQFIASRETVQMLHHEMNGACTEMEGAAVAHVCAANGVPYVVIRSMSDKADGTAHENFPAFMKQAAEASFRIVEQMVTRMEQK